VKLLRSNATPVSFAFFPMVWFHCAGYSNLNPSDGSLYVNDWFERASAYTFEKSEIVELEDDKKS
jgi:hypothetical protein